MLLLNQKLDRTPTILYHVHGLARNEYLRIVHAELGQHRVVARPTKTDAVGIFFVVLEVDVFLVPRVPESDLCRSSDVSGYHANSHLSRCKMETAPVCVHRGEKKQVAEKESGGDGPPQRESPRIYHSTSSHMQMYFVQEA